MVLYTIGEMTLLYGISPATLCARQKRYGPLKPQRTDGGHQLFNDADIDRIRRIKCWIDNDVQVSKVKMPLNNENVDIQNGWRDQRETLLTYLQNGDLHNLRMWTKEHGQDHPAQVLTTHLFIPLYRRLQRQQPALQALLAIPDDVLINYITICLASTRKKQGKNALVVSQNIQDITRPWLEGWIVSQQGWRIGALAHSLNRLRPELFEGYTLLVWCGENRTSTQQ